MKLAICYDECGAEIFIECSNDQTSEQLLASYPEYKFRYWEDSDRYYDQDQGDHYDPEGDCYV